jgi:hypothetical protein
MVADQVGSSPSTTMLTPCPSLLRGCNASSYYLSPCSSYNSSFCGGEDMTRQGSSVSSTSMTEGFGMLRVESSGPSSFSAPFPLSLDEQQDEFPFLSDCLMSSMTEKPGSSTFLQATTGVEHVALRQGDLFRDIGTGFDVSGNGSISYSSFDSLRKNDPTVIGMPWLMPATKRINDHTAHMQRNDSQTSTSTTSSTNSTASQQKAAARRQKQIANGASQPLLPKIPASNLKPAYAQTAQSLSEDTTSFNATGIMSTHPSSVSGSAFSLSSLPLSLRKPSTSASSVSKASNTTCTITQLRI